MKFVKYFVGPTFEREKFAKMLRIDMNVRARALEDSVVLDLDAFNAVSAARMPHWAFINREYIKSKLHTVEAAPEEWPDLNPHCQYQLVLLMDDGIATEVEKAHGLTYLEHVADDVAKDWRDEKSFLSAVVLDADTGEILYTAN